MNKQKPIYYYIYDENKKKVGRINSKYEKLQNLWLKGVAIFVITDDGKLIIEQRTDKTTLTPKDMDLCSGHRDNKEKGKQTVFRELREELGIKKKQIKGVKKVSENVPLIFKGERKFHIKFYATKIKLTKPKELQREEVDRIIKVPLHEGFNLIREEKTKFPYKGNEQKFEDIFKEVEKFVKEMKEQIKGEEK